MACTSLPGSQTVCTCVLAASAALQISMTSFTVKSDTLISDVHHYSQFLPDQAFLYSLTVLFLLSRIFAFDNRINNSMSFLMWYVSQNSV